MATLLQQLCEQEGVKNMFAEERTVNYITEATNQLINVVPQQIYNYVAENLEYFLVPGDLKSTHENIANYAAEMFQNSMLYVSDMDAE
jgi:hypothetical protein